MKVSVNPVYDSNIQWLAYNLFKSVVCLDDSVKNDNIGEKESLFFWKSYVFDISKFNYDEIKSIVSILDVIKMSDKELTKTFYH